MIITIVNYGHPYYRSVIVGSQENTLDALRVADRFMEDTLKLKLDKVQISCVALYNNISVL